MASAHAHRLVFLGCAHRHGQDDEYEGHEGHDKAQTEEPEQEHEEVTADDGLEEQTQEDQDQQACAHQSYRQETFHRMPPGERVKAVSLAT